MKLNKDEKVNLPKGFMSSVKFAFIDAGERKKISEKNFRLEGWVLKMFIGIMKRCGYAACLENFNQNVVSWNVTKSGGIFSSLSN